MALTISYKRPDSSKSCVSSVLPLYVDFGSPDATYVSFDVTFRKTDNSTIETVSGIKAYENPEVSNEFLVNISPYVKPLIIEDLPLTDNYLETDQSMVVSTTGSDTFISATEKIVTASGVVDGASQTNADSFYFVNLATNEDNYFDKISDYVFSDGTNAEAYLTNRESGATISKNGYYWLSVLVEDYVDLDYEIKGYKDNTLVYDRDLASFASNDAGKFIFPASPNAVGSMTWTASPVTTNELSECDYYDCIFTWTGGEAQTDTVTFRFYLKNKCVKNQIRFLNLLGGWDTLEIVGELNKEVTTSREVYRGRRTVSDSGFSGRELNVQSNLGEEVWTANIHANESRAFMEWAKEILWTPRAQILIGSEWKDIVILNNSLNFYQSEAKIFNAPLEFVFANRQRTI